MEISIFIIVILLIVILFSRYLGKSAQINLYEDNLNLNLKYPPYIRIILQNGGYIFINQNNEEGTTELFDNIVHMTFKNR